MLIDRHPYRRGIAMYVTATILLTGCASTTGLGGRSHESRDLTPAERSLRQQSSELTETNIQACLTGGAVAGIAMLLLSQGRRDATQRTMLAALAGCGIGVGVNSYVQERRRQYVYSEQRLQAMIQDLRRDNAKVARLIGTSRKVMSADRRRIAEVNQSYARKKISLAQARREIRAVEDNRNHLEQTLSALKKKEHDWLLISRSERRIGSDTRHLDAEIQKLQEQIATLEEDLRLMDEQIRVSPVSA